MAGLAATGTVVRDEQLAFVGRITHADPDAAADLAHWLDQALAAEPARDIDGGAA